MSDQIETSEENNGLPRRRSRAPRPDKVTAKPANKRGRKAKKMSSPPQTYDLVLSRDRTARLEMPGDLSADDVDAIKMQIDAIWKLAEIQEGIRVVAK